MVKEKLPLFVLYVYLIFFSKLIYANPNIDQWQDSDKSYKDLIEQGFQVKAYDMNTIETGNGYKLLLFVTVLQKNNDVYECQEYQTIDKFLETLELSLVCRQLVKPYQTGVGT